MSKVKYLKFWSKGKKGQVLSNFSELNVEIDGRTYKSGEHAFHASKYFTSANLYEKPDSKRKKALIEYANKFVGLDSDFETPLDAKKGGSKTKFRLKPNEIEAWGKNSIATQKKINKYKYETYKEVRDVLEKYKDHILLHQDNRAKPDTIWGARISKEDGSLVGNNLLGKMWEETRKEMTGEQSTTPDPTSPEPEPEKPTTPEPEPEKPTSPEPEPEKPTSPEPEPEKPTSPEPEPEQPTSPEPEPEQPTSPEPEPEQPKPIEISDDVPINESEISHIELPGVKIQKSKEGKKSIYNKNIIEKKINLHISELGNNLTELIERKTKNIYENTCTNDGFIKKNSIEIISYSSGFVENSNISFNVVFEALVFRPVEGMIIYNCIVENVTRAGIKAKTNEEYSPVVIFIAKDHAYKSDYFNTIKESDKINIKVIGHRYELKDSKISVIASLVEKRRNIKIVLKK